MGALLFIAVLFIAGMYVARTVTRATDNLISHLSAQSSDLQKGHGDLTKRINASSRDEFGEISRSFDTFTEALQKIVLQLSNYSEQLASASEQISCGASQSAERSRIQFDQTTQVATAMQEMSATVAQVSENSNRAADDARQAADT